MGTISRRSNRYADYSPAYRRAAYTATPIYALLAFVIAQQTLLPNGFPLTAPSGGDEGTRTPDPRLAKAVLSQLSYIPRLPWFKVGLRGLEPLTPALSAQCSNQLSYRPETQTSTIQK